MARHADLAAIVARQDGSEAARARVTALLGLAAGETTVEAAAAALGISTQRLHELRERMLAGAVQVAEPLPPGRPSAAAAVDPREARIAELESQIGQLRFALECACLRTELAMAFGGRLPSLKNDARSRRDRREHARRLRRAGIDPAAGVGDVSDPAPGGPP